MQQLENCSSAEEIMTLAKNANIPITLEQAQKAFDLLNSENVPDDWMNQLVGGRCSAPCSDKFFNFCGNKICDQHKYWSWK